jgi:hypothetical protein
LPGRFEFPCWMEYRLIAEYRPLSRLKAAMKRLFFLPALTVAVVVLAGCDSPANVSSSISEPGLASYDERLVGTWYMIGRFVPDERLRAAGTLTVSPGKDGIIDVAGVLALSEMGSYSNEENEDRKVSAGFAWIRWAAHASVIDGETYFNARNVDTTFFEKKTGEPPEVIEDDPLDSHPERGYWIIRAEISEDDLLTLHILWERDLDIASRKVTCGEKCSFKVYDLSSEELVAVIRAAEPGELFTERFRLARVEGVYPPQPED